MANIRKRKKAAGLRRPYIFGAALSLPFYIVCRDTFVYSHRYGSLYLQTFRAYITILCITIFLAVSGLIAGLLFLRRRSGRGERVAAGLLIMFFALLSFGVFGFSGEWLRLHMYSQAQGNLSGEIAYRLFDVRMFFAIFTAITMTAAAKRPRVSDLVRCCLGLFLSIFVLNFLSLIAGQIIVRRYFSEGAATAVTTVFAVVLAICALWLIFGRKRKQ